MIQPQTFIQGVILIAFVCALYASYREAWYYRMNFVDTLAYFMFTFTIGIAVFSFLVIIAALFFGNIFTSCQ